MHRIILFVLICLLTPTACTGPTFQCDVYTWGYLDGEATYLTWKQCDFKACDEVATCVTNHMESEIITYGSFPYEFDSLIFDKDCWTNECPDALYTYIFE